MTDPLNTHRRLLAGENVPVHLDEPQIGYWRMRGRNGRWERVLIARDYEGDLYAIRDGDEALPLTVWPWAMRHPISYEDYLHHEDQGYFPDEPPPVGHNKPPEEVASPYSKARQTASSLIDSASKIIPLGIEADGDLAAEIVNRMTALATEADGLHKAEKQPWLDGGREVDNRWRFREELRSTVKDVREKVLTPILREVKRKTEVEMARLTALANEEAAKAWLPSVEPGVLIPPRVGSGGSGSKRIGLRKRKVAVVTDPGALFAAIRDWDETKAFLQTIADRAARNDRELPGVEIKTEESA